MLSIAINCAMAEGKNEDLTIPSKDEAVCMHQIQPIIDLWKQNERTIEDANHLIEIQSSKATVLPEINTGTCLVLTDH